MRKLRIHETYMNLIPGKEKLCMGEKRSLDNSAHGELMRGKGGEQGKYLPLSGEKRHPQIYYLVMPMRWMDGVID